jgi:hypothetical protein
VQDVDWDTQDAHYRVRIYGQWFVVPDDAVVTEPNRFGPAVVWPYNQLEPPLVGSLNAAVEVLFRWLAAFSVDRVLDPCSLVAHSLFRKKCSLDADQNLDFVILGSGENGQPRGWPVTPVKKGVLVTLSKFSDFADLPSR